jgi:amino acid transporter
LERSNKLNKSSPGLLTGLVLGVLCLTVALGLYAWAPDFIGFYNRPGAQPAMPVWNLLLLLALVNFVYAGVSYFLQRKVDQAAKEARKPDE